MSWPLKYSDSLKHLCRARYCFPGKQISLGITCLYTTVVIIVNFKIVFTFKKSPLMINLINQSKAQLHYTKLDQQTPPIGVEVPKDDMQPTRQSACLLLTIPFPSLPRAPASSNFGLLTMLCTPRTAEMCKHQQEDTMLMAGTQTAGKYLLQIVV